MFDFSIWSIVAGAICLLISLPFHECAHGWAAYKLGDPTAKNMGRLTLNPIKHLDPLGAVALVFLGFGWAKPVEINPRYFRNPKAGMAITAAAGPLSNLLLAYIFMVVLKILYAVGLISSGGTVANAVFDILVAMISINITLAVFNLIPVPPLDGSRVAFYFLPDHIYFTVMRYEQIIMLGLMVVLFAGVLDRPLRVAVYYIYNLLDMLTFFIGV